MILSVKEVSEKCGVTLTSVYRWIEKGQISFTVQKRIGKKPRKVISEEELQNFIQERVG